MPHAVKTEHRYVHKDLAVCGGDPVIVGTRIPVRLIYQRTQDGETIRQAYPNLTPRRSTTRSAMPMITSRKSNWKSSERHRHTSTERHRHPADLLPG